MLVRLAHLCPSAVLQSKSVAQKPITKLSGVKRSPGDPYVMLLSVVILQKKERKGLYSIDAILENTILPFTFLEKSNAFDIKFHILILKSWEIFCMLCKVRVVLNEISIIDFYC